MSQLYGYNNEAMKLKIVAIEPLGAKQLFAASKYKFVVSIPCLFHTSCSLCFRFLIDFNNLLECKTNCNIFLSSKATVWISITTE